VSTTCRRFLLLATAVTIVQVVAAPASAQEQPLGQVDISFDVGEYDAELDDWAIDVVEVTGGLAVGEEFTVEVLDADDDVLFTATQPYAGPSTRIEVSVPVAVADVASAGVAQPQPIVGGVVIERPEVDWSASGGGGSGQLAMSMVMAVIVVAIIFRSPLPSASTQRWTK
jgi:hypothetical protein